MSGAEGHEVSEPWRLRLPMNLWPMDHPLTPSLSPSEGERVPEGRVRRFKGSGCKDLLGKILSQRSNTETGSNRMITPANAFG